MNWFVFFMFTAVVAFAVGFWPTSKTEKFISLGLALFTLAQVIGHPAL